MPRHAISLLIVLHAAPLADAVAQEPATGDSTRSSVADSVTTGPSRWTIPLEELRALVLDSLTAHLRDTLAPRRILVRPTGAHIACPMPVLVPVPGAAIPIPTARPAPRATVPMPTDRTACVNPLYRARQR